MAETLVESMERYEADIDTKTARLNTLEQFYTEKYNQLRPIVETRPEVFKTRPELVSFADALKAIPVTKDRVKTLNLQIDSLSDRYVKLMKVYEEVKDTHPELL
jgi:hypothetical protein